MNRGIMNLAIEQVKQMFNPPDSLCAVCHKNPIDFFENAIIEIQGIPTEVGLPTCNDCFINIRIVIGELSSEY